MSPAVASTDAPPAAAPAPRVYDYDRERLERFLERVRELGPEAIAHEQRSLERALRFEAEPDGPMLAPTVGSEDPALLFVVGNQLFSRSPEVSATLHRRAYELDPGNPFIAFELAIHHHRLGRCADAMPYYARWLAEAPDPGPAPGLVAHCQVVLGDVDAARTSFAGLDHAHQHVALESIFASTFSAFDPWTLRDRLAAEARAGSPDAWLELLVHDLAFRRDPWNASRNGAALEFDVPAARRALARDRERLAAVDLLVADEPAESVARARAVGTSFPHRLPGPPAVAERLFDLRLEDPAFDDAAAMTAYGDDLRRRFEANDAVGNRLYRRLLAHAHDTARIAEVDAVLCERGSLVACLATAHDATAFTDLAARHPNDARVPAASLLAALEVGRAPARDDVVAYLRTSPYAMPSSYGWKFAFLALDALDRDAPLGEPLTPLFVEALREELAERPYLCDPWALPEVRASMACRGGP